MKTKLFPLAILGLTLAACSSEEETFAPNHQNIVAVPRVTANFATGSMSVSTTGNTFGAKAFTRALADYETPASFASAAAAVTAYTPTFAAQPAIPADAESIMMPNPWNPDADPVPATLKGGHSYVINGDEAVLSNMSNYFATEGDDIINIYVKGGANLTEMLNTDNGKVAYYIFDGATLTTTKASARLYNWGTVNQNGLSQYASWNGSANVCDQVIENYSTMNCTGTIQVEGTLYSETDLSALFKGNGAVYVDANLVAEDGFGLGGKLYVGGELSGDMNLNNNLAAHVGSIKTDKELALKSNAQLVVEGNVEAPSADLNGDAVQFVVLGAMNVPGMVNVASSTKGYAEILECGNLTVSGSEMWAGCSFDVKERMYMTNANITLADGAFIHAGEAECSYTTKMEMMSGSYLLVDTKLQLNNADTQSFNGSGTVPAIVQAATIGANFEDFINTFTGNIGVGFEAWDYNSSTGLIDENVNLKKLSGVADSTVIAQTDCCPGYNTDKADDETPEIPIDGCDLTVDIPLDEIVGEWIVQADDFAIHNGDRLYENIAKTTDATGQSAVKDYIVVKAGEKVTVSVNDLCDLYTEYAGKTNDEGQPYVNEDGMLTLEVYLWPGHVKTISDGVNSYDVIVPIPADEFGITADGVAGKYIVGDYEEFVDENGEPGEKYSYDEYGNDEYNVKVQAYMSYSGGGNSSDMTSYVKVSIHITPKNL